eukprot:COSAG01_NODE_243_length_20572_cov_24.956137_19_plen_113_part_00
MNSYVSKMEARQGKTFSFQLSTHRVDKLSRVTQTDEGHYIQQLDPPVYVPFNASPKIALYDLTFSNSFANIDKLFGNQTIEWAQATRRSSSGLREKDKSSREDYRNQKKMYC